MSTSVAKPKADKPTKFVGVLMAPQLHKQLAEVARLHERSVGAEIRLAVKRHIAPYSD
jgi:hypothetical protein